MRSLIVLLGFVCCQVAPSMASEAQFDGYEEFASRVPRERLVAMAPGLHQLVPIGSVNSGLHQTAPSSGTWSTALSAVALNGAAGTRTFNIPLGGGYADIVIAFNYTHANNGTLTFTCTNSDDTGTTDFVPYICDTIVSGTCTLAASGVWVTPSFSAAKKGWFRAGFLGLKDLECVVAHGGAPNASDVLTVKYIKVTQ